MPRPRKAATTEPKTSKKKAAAPVVDDANAVAGQQGEAPAVVDGGENTNAVADNVTDDGIVTGEAGGEAAAGEGEASSEDASGELDAGSENPAVEETEEQAKPAAKVRGKGKKADSEGDFPAEFEIDNQTRTRIVAAGAIVQPYSKEKVIIRSERDLKRCEVNCEQLARLNKGEITVQRA